MSCRALLVSLACLLLAGCQLPRQRAASASGGGDPTQREVPLKADAPDWNAFLVIDNGSTGIWTVDAFQVFPQYGSPEVVGLDDKGRCWVMVSYSGKWTPFETVHDGKWLGGLAHGDVDPRIPGAELYAGSQQGNVYQVVSYPHGALDHRLIAHLPGREIHTLVAGDVDPGLPGAELVVFTRPGGLNLLTPTAGDGRFELRELGDLAGRVRDAVRLPDTEFGRPTIATVSRTGELRLLQLTGGVPSWLPVHGAPMGLGRLALRPSAPGEPLVLYATHDDGRILRLERTGSGTWNEETIYYGPQGPRGVAAGRFDADPGVETVAVFGYSQKVQLLTRKPEGWMVETLFRDRDKGHWLAVAELDGRNGTQELLASGYGARIVMLTRPPGYGVPGATVESE